jgi:Flp pilus assembly protein TadD
MAAPSGSLERGLALHRSGDLPGAAREYEALLAREPDRADALHLLGLVVYRAGRLDDARALIGDASAMNARASRGLVITATITY